jgi:hypothetical protein
MARFRKSTEVQSVLFDKTKWTPSAAKKWLASHGYDTPAVDTTADYHRYRQSPPFNFEKGTFRTITLGAASRGIKAVIAVPKGGAAPNPKRKKKAPRKSPWVPTLLVDLADAKSIDLEGGEQLKFPFSGNFAVCATRSGTELWIVSRKKGKNVRTTDEKGEKLYEAFTGFEHDELGKMIHVNPKNMVKIGRAMNIVYRSDKFSRPGDTSDYIHPFTHYPTVSVDNVKRPSIVALRGGRIKVRKEGITG